MPERNGPPTDVVVPDEPSVRAGYEVVDVHVPSAVAGGVLFVGCAILLHAVMWGLYRQELPAPPSAAVSPPVQMPGEPPVNERVGSLPAPRLEGLEELRAEPPSYRTSAPLPGANPRELHPENLRADRQERLLTYGWVDKKKGIAHIPIDRAMEAVLQNGQVRGPGKGKGR